MYQSFHCAGPCVCSQLVNYTGEKIQLGIQANNNRIFPPTFLPHLDQATNLVMHASIQTAPPAQRRGTRGRDKNEQAEVKQGALLPAARVPLCNSSLI